MKMKGLALSALCLVSAVAMAADVTQPRTSTDKVVQKFLTLDLDGNAAVSLDEYSRMVQARMVKRYAAMDANQDGQVTADEYRLFWLNEQSKWYRLNR
ncbi:MAG: thymidylate synthase [Zetaproteobacteria bacterium]|nr:thymidylate synthase [Zetaproteobacteria bacterium]